MPLGPGKLSVITGRTVLGSSQQHRSVCERIRLNQRTQTLGIWMAFWPGLRDLDCPVTFRGVGATVYYQQSEFVTFRKIGDCQLARRSAVRSAVASEPVGRPVSQPKFDCLLSIFYSTARHTILEQVPQLCLTYAETSLRNTVIAAACVCGGSVDLWEWWK